MHGDRVATSGQRSSGLPDRCSAAFEKHCNADCASDSVSETNVCACIQLDDQMFVLLCINRSSDQVTEAT